MLSLRRDRAALVLSFVLPIVFFSIFAVIFGGRRNVAKKIDLIVVDQDHSPASQRLIEGLKGEGSLFVATESAPKKGISQPAYTAVTAEAAVRAGAAPVALIVPPGFGKNPISWEGGNLPVIQMLKDPSDMVASQVIAGLLQKVAMTSMLDVMAGLGSKHAGRFAGGRQSGGGALLSVTTRDVIGENKDNPMVSFYAAAIGVMFLLFTASGAAGSLLDEVENGTLDRVLSSRVTMTTLLAGKVVYSTLLAFSQLVLMFLWAWAVFKLDFLSHIPGFVVMGVSTAFAVGAFGILLASVCRTRAQLGALSTLVILVMSSIGGSMFPRFLMPEAMQKAGLLTINAWAIDGFTKVFWRDEPVSNLWPQVLVLLTAGVALFAIARKLAQRWDYT